MSNSLFSILIANYNNGHFFIDCYESIMNQTYSNWEVIIVDDNSSDDSIKIINKLIKNDNRFKLFFNNKNEGCGLTKRKCVELASGDICGFLDPDDTLEIEALEEMVKAHNQNIECSIISSRHYLVDLNLQDKTCSKHGEPIPYNFSYLTFNEGAITAFATFKRKYYNKTLGIDIKFKRAVDQDLYYKLEEVGKHFFINQYLYNYRINSNSISCNENTYKARYWHFIAKKDAFKRRNKIINSINYSKHEFKTIEYNYWKSRMKLSTKRKKIKSKYYFLLMMFKTKPFAQLKYKLKCLLFYNKY